MSSISQRPWSFAMSARPLICDREYPEPSGLFGSIARSIFVADGDVLCGRAAAWGVGLWGVATSRARGPVLTSLWGGGGAAGGGATGPAPWVSRAEGWWQ